jgi:nitroimidazol reductase NimA-like FMN-containing flavoprotein (pyridoxamine 5'-phosphate oxidase superfamily)
MQETTGLEILDSAECRRLLPQAPIGRVVFTEKALPAAQPVNFLVHENAVVLRTTAGSRLANAAHNAILAFEVDDIDVELQTGWNVTVVGPAEVVDDPDELATLARLPLRAWAPGERDVFVRIRIDLLQGRRITGS